MDHDHDNEGAGVQLILAALALLLITGFFSLNELTYYLWGKTVAAQVREAKRVTVAQGRGQQAEMLSVAYSFPIAGGNIESASDLLPSDWPMPGATVDVQYLTGRRVRSRIVGRENMIAVYIFLGSLVALAGVIFKFYLEAKASERRPTRRSH